MDISAIDGARFTRVETRPLATGDTSLLKRNQAMNTKSTKGKGAVKIHLAHKAMTRKHDDSILKSESIMLA
jgi:hypothetical protein